MSKIFSATNLSRKFTRRLIKKKKLDEKTSCVFDKNPKTRPGPGRIFTVFRGQKHPRMGCFPRRENIFFQFSSIECKEFYGKRLLESLWKSVDNVLCWGSHFPAILAFHPTQKDVFEDIDVSKCDISQKWVWDGNSCSRLVIEMPQLKPVKLVRVEQVPGLPVNFMF